MKELTRFVLAIACALLPSKTFADATENDNDSIQGKQPNIVIFFSDDAGYADFGFQPNARNDIKKFTPNIDSIAQEGARFTNAYMSGCVCSPSRAGLMTGRYQGRFGFDNNLPPGFQSGLSLDVPFLTRRLQHVGYTTGLVGKWHLGYPPQYRPNARGFDWFYGCLQGSRSYFPMENPTANRVFRENDTPTEEKGYVTDRIGDAAERFIGKQAETGNPFFLFVSFTSPHSPMHAKETDLALVPAGVKPGRRKYIAMVKSMDDNIGKVLKSLKVNKLDESTLVLFTNDNGGQTQTFANNQPLRGRKGNLYEGGVRVPWAMKWPKVIEPQTVIDDPVISLDLVPTLNHAAGIQNDGAWRLDGVDLTARLNGSQKTLAERTLFWRKGGKKGAIAARKGDWKIVFNRNQDDAKPELFNLAKDLSEVSDVSAENPDVVKTLVKEMDAWEGGLVEPLWGQNSGRRGKQAQKQKAKKSDK